jgi:DnaJ-class molecular chaperone
MSYKMAKGERVERVSKCASCTGHGRIADPDSGHGQECSSCGGSGVVLVIKDETGKFTRQPGTRNGWQNEPGEVHGKCPSCQGRGCVEDPQHGQSQRCEPCHGVGLIPHPVCEVHQCQARALPERKICESHAFPAARPPGTTGRRAAVLATRKKLEEEAKVSAENAED